MRSIGLLMRKDLFSARVLLGGSSLIILAIWVLFSLFMGNMAVFYGTIVFYSMIITLFTAEDNTAVADINYLLPVSRSQQITARYAYAGVVAVVVSAATALMQLLPQIVLRPGTAPILLFLQLLMITVFMIDISFPIIYKLGVQKARIFTVVIYVVFVVVGSAMQSVVGELFQQRNLRLPLAGALAGGLVLMLLLLPLSMHLSKKWYERR